MSAYFVPAIGGFIDSRFRDDGTYPEWPADAVLISEEEESLYRGKAAPAGKILGTLKGRPAWVDAPPLSLHELLTDAENKKALLLSEAAEITQAWQTQLLLGIISDADKATLTKWMQYIQALQAVDVSTAPDISWPVKPE